MEWNPQLRKDARNRKVLVRGQSTVLRQGKSQKLRDAATTDKGALERLRTWPEDTLAYVFSHGQFIQAIQSIVIDSELTEQEKMRKFGGKEIRPSRMPS